MTFRNRVFIYVITVMAYVFILFHVTVSCNGGSCFKLENVQHCK